jgi:rare lipoprotein A
MRMRKIVVFCALVCGLVCAASAAEEGLASFFQYSRNSGLFAAHRSLPKGSQVRVVNLDNGHSVVVTIVDRGPFIRGRVIDVSPEAAVALGFRQAGLAHVRIDPISPEAPGSPPLPEEQVAASAPDEICKRDADRLERLRGKPTGDEIAQFKRELGCEKLRPQLLALASSADAAPAPVRTEVPSGTLTEAKAAPGPGGVKSASGAYLKWRAPAPPGRVRRVASWHGFRARLYAGGCGYEASCMWRGRARESALNQTRFSILRSNVALVRLGHWFE